MSVTSAELAAAVLDWLRLRNGLSADCRALGVGSGAQDSGRWGEELARRCEPLRRAAERYAREQGER